MEQFEKHSLFHLATVIGCGNELSCFFMLSLEFQVNHSAGYEVCTVLQNGVVAHLWYADCTAHLASPQVVRAFEVKSGKVVVALS